MKKRLLALFMSLCLVVGLLPTAVWAEESSEGADVALSGSCGDSTSWTLEENNDDLYYTASDDNKVWRFYEDAGEGRTKAQAYTLTISGSGAMEDYTRHTAPWGVAIAAILNAAGTEVSASMVSDIANPRITQVKFAEGSSVTHISSHAFRTTSIRTITIPASVESIGDYALIQCRQLRSIQEETPHAERPFYVEDDVIYERYTTEDGQDGLALRFFALAKETGAYTIKDGVTALGSNSMQKAQFTGVTIPKSVRSVNSFAFSNSNIESVTFAGSPSFGTEFETGATPGQGAFNSCESLREIKNFPNVDALPAQLFSTAKSLETFTIPETVTSIGNSAFSNTAITSITIPAGVKEMGNALFSTDASTVEGEEPTRTALTVTFEKGSQLSSIGNSCFAGLDSYQLLFDPADADAYNMCAQRGYQVSLIGQELPTHEYFTFGWENADSVMITGLTEAGKQQSEIVIPDTVSVGDAAYFVTGIGQGVFAGTNKNDGANTTLTSVTMGANVKHIGSGAFQYCSKLTTVDFSKAAKLEHIGDSAFYYTCQKDTDLSACTALTTIGTNAFRYSVSSDKKTVKLPGSITEWGAFALDNTGAVVSFPIPSQTMETLDAVLKNGTDRFTLGGVSGTWENLSYELRYQNGAYTAVITGYKPDIEDAAKETVVIPDTIDGVKVTEVVDKAFSNDGNDNYKKIKTVTIGANVAKIGEYAFASDGKVTDGTLESVTFLPGIPVEIGKRAFQKYSTNHSFTTFDAGDREISLGLNVFLDSRLTTINIPGVKSLGIGDFYGIGDQDKTLVINGGAACVPLTFKDSTGGEAQVNSIKNATVYAVNVAADKVTQEIKDLGSITSNILCLTDGGSVDVINGNKDAATGLYTPVYVMGDGKVFDGWYAGDTKLTGQAAAGTTYTAHWTDSQYKVPDTLALEGYVYGGAPVSGNTEVAAPAEEADASITVTGSEHFTAVANGLKIIVTPKDKLAAGEYNEAVVVRTGDGATHTIHVTLTVTPAALTITGLKAADRSYDGTTTVALTGGELVGVLPGDDVTADMPAAGEVADANVGEGKAVALKDIALSGTDAGNYTLALPEVFVTITKATPAITIKADPAALTGSGTVTLTVEKPEDGEVSVTCDKADVKVTANKESGTFSVTLPNSSETYTFTATVKYGENANYVDGTAPCTVTVTYQSTSHGGGGSSRGSSYAVSTPKADNGSVSVNNGASAKKGETVTITVKPDAGYEIDKVTVTDSKGNQITVTDKGDGKFSFTMPDSKVDVKATFVKTEPEQPSKTGFVDVPDNSWYADAADFVAQRGLMSGIGDNLFGGSQNTTRAMLMTILARMDGQDVTGGATWYEKAMTWAKSNGVSDGTMPEKNITREQLATMLYSYAKLKGIDTTQGGMAVREFNDYDSISGWAGQSMTWAVNAGILSGRGNNTLAPTAGATRAEMAVMLQQFVGLMEK